MAAKSRIAQPPPDSPWTDRAGAAAYAGVSLRTVATWLANGDLPSYPMPRGRGTGARNKVLIDLRDVEKLIRGTSRRRRSRSSLSR